MRFVELRHAFDKTRRRILPLDKLSLQAATRHIEMIFDATVQIFRLLGSIIVADVDCRDGLYPTKTKAPQVLSKQRRFTYIAPASMFLRNRIRRSIMGLADMTAPPFWLHILGKAGSQGTWRESVGRPRRGCR